MKYRFAVVALSICVALTGCIVMPESGVAARQQFLGNTASGIEGANKSFAAWIEEQTEAQEVLADGATFDDLATRLESGYDPATERAWFIADREETRSQIRAWKATPLSILAEYDNAARYSRQAEALTADELRVIQKAKAITSPTGGNK